MEILNTHSRHLPVYRDFFARCSLVVSVPRTFMWCGDWIPQGGGVRITQKLPWRTYVGIEQTDIRSFVLGSYQLFYPAKKRFTPYTLKEPWQSRLLEALRTALSPHLNGGIIHILTEGPTQRATSSAPTLAAALAGLITLLNGQLQYEALGKWPKVSAYALTQDTALQFNAIFNMACNISNIFESPIVRSGGASFTSLSWGHTPQVYLWTKTLNELKDFSEHIPYIGMDIEELIPSPFEGTPLHFSLVFSGHTTEVGGAMRLRSLGINEKIKEIETGVEKLANSVPAQFQERLAQLLGILDGTQSYIRMNALFTMRVLFQFLELYRQGPDALRLENFFTEYRHYTNWAKLLAPYPPTLPQLLSSAEILADILHIPFAIRQPFQAAGDFVVVTPPSMHDEFMKRLLRSMRKVGLPLERDYSSTIDGLGREGLRVDQWLEKGIYSEFVSAHARLLSTRNKDGNQERLVLTPEQFAKQKSKFDMLIDVKESRIFVRGQSLTSRELHSTKKTIEVLQILEKQFSKEVQAAILPPSSYVDRNEMQSKIISPLIQAVRRRTGKRLPLYIHGRIGQNFTLALGPGPVRIWWVETIRP